MHLVFLFFKGKPASRSQHFSNLDQRLVKRHHFLNDVQFWEMTVCFENITTLKEQSKGYIYIYILENYGLTMRTSLHAVCLCEFFNGECSTLTWDSPSGQVRWLRDAVGSGCLSLLLS